MKSVFITEHLIVSDVYMGHMGDVMGVGGPFRVHG